jgi:hypothetical protein
LEKGFSMDSQKYLYGVFELPLPRNARNVPEKKTRKKKSAGGWVGLGFSKCTGGSVDFLFAAPRVGSSFTSYFPLMIPLFDFFNGHFFISSEK